MARPLYATVPKDRTPPSTGVTMDDLSDIREMYNTGWDAEANRLERHQLEADITWRYLKLYLPPHGRLLEVGFGTGFYTFPLARRGYRITAVDLFELRRKENLEKGRGPFWQLYAEGFAQRIEHLVASKPTWHMATGINDETWLPWCEENLSYLASEFLESSDSEEKTRRFFGHWYDLRGKKQCGYYLGHEVLARMEETDPLRTIALYPEPEKRILEVVQMMAGNYA